MWRTNARRPGVTLRGDYDAACLRGLARRTVRAKAACERLRSKYEIARLLISSENEGTD
jgi:hypothetical protein